MSKFVYAVKVSSIPKFFAHIQSAGVPKEKVGPTYLKSVGFTSGNDSYLTGILKALGFLDGSNMATDRWRAYRNTEQAPFVMAEAILEAYSALFDVYPDAYQRDNEALTNFVRTHSDLADKTVQLAVATFKSLVELADFTKSAPGETIVKVQPSPGDAAAAVVSVSPPVASTNKQSPAININIELTIPATDDKTVYENFFRAMKEHLFDGHE